jgi:apolipoprotein N-acyltransferase
MNRLLKWKWELSAPLMGVWLTLAFSPYDFAYVALPALMFLYRAWSVQSPRQAALSGYLFGLGLFGSGIWWVYVSIHDFGGADALSAGLLTLLLVGIWALFPAITGALAARVLSSQVVWFRVTAVALLWVMVEYFRGFWLLNGFPWLQIAYSQLQTPLAGFAPLVGVYGIGFLLALSAFALVEMLDRKLPPTHGLLFLLLIWGAGGWLKTVQWTQAIGEPIKITLVQGNIGQGQKWQPRQKLNTLKLYQQLTEQHWDSNVIIWPETAIPAFLDQVKVFFLDPLAAMAREHKVDLVVSLPTSGQGKEYFNSVLVLGESPGLYHKNHLLPFGEYLPLQPLSGWVLDLIRIPLGNFSAGDDSQTLLTAGGFPFVTTICYEDAFGELVARQIGDAAYIVNVTNDAWFGDTSQPYQHMQMARMRALETGRYLVRATNTGLTGFVAPDGSISKQAPLFTTTTLTDTIVPMGGITPYATIGDNVVFAVLIIAVLFLYGLASLEMANKRPVLQE